MTEFTKQELLRITHKLSETDPSTTAYHCLMQSIEYLNSIGQTVDEIIAMENPAQPAIVNFRNTPAPEKEQDWVKVDPETEEPVAETPAEPAKEKPKKMEAISHAELAEKEIEPEPETAEQDWVKEAETAEPEKEYNQAEVRAALASARRKGVNVAALIKSHGADNFTAVDHLHYPAIMREIEEALQNA